MITVLCQIRLMCCIIVCIVLYYLIPYIYIYIMLAAMTHPSRVLNLDMKAKALYAKELYLYN